MANYFHKLPIDHGDANIWGPKTLANLKFGVPDITCYIYDDAGTLKVSTGWVGIDDGTVKGVAEIDTVTSILITGVTSGIWAEIYMTVSATSVSFAAVDIAGATTLTTVPSGFLSSYTRTKGGHYINAARRCIGIAWKTSGGALGPVINAHHCTISSGGDLASFTDPNGNTGFGTADIEAWPSGDIVMEFPLAAITANNSSPYINLCSNAYYDTAWKYKSTYQATLLSMGASGVFSFLTAASGTIDTAITWVSKLKIDNATDSIGIGGYAGGSNRDSYFYFASDASLFWDESEGRLYIPSIVEGNISYFDQVIPRTGGGTGNIGSATYYYNDVSSKAFTDRSAIWIEDPNAAYDIIKNAKNEDTTGFCAKVESRGQNRLKYSDFPDYCWDRAEEEAEEDIVFDDKMKINESTFTAQNRDVPVFTRSQTIIPKGTKTRYRVTKKKVKNPDTGIEEEIKEIGLAAEGFDLSAGISVLFGAVKKLIQKVEELEGNK